jgi:hypothetical protein
MSNSFLHSSPLRERTATQKQMNRQTAGQLDRQPNGSQKTEPTDKTPLVSTINTFQKRKSFKLSEKTFTAGFGERF